MSDIQIVRYDDQYRPLPGIFKNATPRPLEHNFHIAEMGAGQLPFNEPIARDRYRMFQFAVGLVNVSDNDYLFPNSFNRPDLYMRSAYSTGRPRDWAVGSKFVKLSLDGEFNSVAAVMVWNIVNSVPGGPPPLTGPFAAGIAPGYGAYVPEALYCGVDITDMPDGKHTVFISLDDGTVTLAEEAVNVDINGFDVKLALV